MTIKLSEDEEVINSSDGTTVTKIVETHFQMNYQAGEWKRIKKYRKAEDVPVSMWSLLTVIEWTIFVCVLSTNEIMGFLIQSSFNSFMRLISYSNWCLLIQVLFLKKEFSYSFAMNASVYVSQYRVCVCVCARVCVCLCGCTEEKGNCSIWLVFFNTQFTSCSSGKYC